MTLFTPLTPFLKQCQTIVGDQYVLTDDEQIRPFVTDYRKRFVGSALAVIKPANTAQVAAIVRLCATHRVAIVPQGGNTGLVLGSVPTEQKDTIVLSLTRLNQIRDVDTINNTITVEAGCVLQQVQQAASQVQRYFALSLASEGSCTIGGNLSTNAGGTAVLHYGNARALCLGLEVVTPAGEVWHGLRGLRKDNTGYDLRDLYIGAEGTLGVITAAVLTLHSEPRQRSTALVAIQEVKDALALLQLARTNSHNAVLTGFELMSAYCVELVQRHFSSINVPPLTACPYYVLIELSSQAQITDNNLQAAFENVMEHAFEAGLIVDATIANSIAQSQNLWQLRESISEAQAAEGKNIKHDISVPISNIGDFIKHTDALLQAQFINCRMVTFGHVGDGNLHYNVSAPPQQDNDAFLNQQADINRVVYDSVAQFGGSISAEHGLGALKIDDITRYKNQVELNIMRNIKRALDPLNIMNPGKVIHPFHKEA